jgi:hypothetical protein
LKIGGTIKSTPQQEGMKIITSTESEEIYIQLHGIMNFQKLKNKSRILLFS